MKDNQLQPPLIKYEVSEPEKFWRDPGCVVVLQNLFFYLLNILYLTLVLLILVVCLRYGP